MVISLELITFVTLHVLLDFSQTQSTILVLLVLSIANNVITMEIVLIVTQQLILGHLRMLGVFQWMDISKVAKL